MSILLINIIFAVLNKHLRSFWSFGRVQTKWSVVNDRKKQVEKINIAKQ